MSNDIIIPQGSNIYAAFNAALDKRCVFITGLPGVGKSLYIQQFSTMAANAGRVVHLLQWDVTREAFQTAEVMAKYPEVDGVTHAMIRKAVGVWTRQGILDWHNKYSDDKHILIGELPLFGNRLIEVAQQQDDEVEALLSGDKSAFIVPVPSVEVKAHISDCRADSISQPAHEREAADAPPEVVDASWQEVLALAVSLGLVEKSNADKSYNPKGYADVYEHLLQHRPTTILPIEQVLPTVSSVYDLGVIATEIAASTEQVGDIFAEIEQLYSLQEVDDMVNQWYKI